MPEIIEHGHLYIAQPPLFKVERGRSEVYLKDQAALDSYLVEQGIDGAALHAGSGETLTGRDLLNTVLEARSVDNILRAFPTHCPRPLLEHSAIAGILSPGRVAHNPQSRR